MDPIDNIDKDRSRTPAPPEANGLDHALRKSRTHEKLFGTPLHVVKLDRFTVLELIGSGGMGEVYAAYDEELDRKVALKLVRKGPATSEHAHKRLRREAKGLARVAHPNVVPIYEIGSAGGRMFIAMEFIRGHNLATWLQTQTQPDSPTYRRTVLDIFIGAGRGLQAAHQRGIVHRDFKPANVLIGEDERPRVVDFGLARFADLLDREPPPLGRLAADAEFAATQADAPIADRPAGDLTLTAHGQRIGTPRYMSPEQLSGLPADSRSDQFSFCVALYEALYRQRPFPGDTLESLRESVQAGERQAVPRDTDVPASIQHAIERGLSIEPTQRFPSMEALLYALEKGRVRPRRQWPKAVLVALVALALIGLYASLQSSHDPCARPGEGIDRVWNQQRKSSLKQAFAATSNANRDAIFASLTEDLDGYADAWRAQAFDSCQASLVRGAQSQALHDRRMACLRPGMNRLDTLLTELERNAPELIGDAGLLLESLPAPSACRDHKALAYGLEPPPKNRAAQVKDVRRRLDESRLALLRQRRDQAKNISSSQLQVLDSGIDYPPLRAEILHELGAALARIGDDASVREGEALLAQAQRIAVAHRHDALAIDIWHELVISSLRNPQSAARSEERLRSLQAAITRAGDHRWRRAATARLRGQLAYRAGAFERAVTDHEEALAHIDGDATFPGTMRAAYLQGLGKSLKKTGHYDRSEQSFASAIALLGRSLGADHPRVADARLDLGLVYVKQGREQQAGALFQQIVDTLARQLDKNHVLYAKAALQLAEILRKRSELGKAMALVSRAQRSYVAHYGQDSPRLADVQLRLGAIAFRRGLLDEAESAYRRALAIRIRALGPDHNRVGYPQASLAEALLWRGDAQGALTAIEQARERFGPTLAKQPALDAFVRAVRGQALLDLGRTGEAIPELAQAECFYRGRTDDDDMARADGFWGLARALRANGQDATQGTAACPSRRARELALSARAIYEAQPAEVATPISAVRTWLDKKPAH